MSGRARVGVAGGRRGVSGLVALGGLVVFVVVTTWWLSLGVIAAYVIAYVLTHSPVLEHASWNLATKVKDRVEFTSWAAVVIGLDLALVVYVVVMLVWPIAYATLDPLPWVEISSAWDSPRVVGRTVAVAIVVNLYIYDTKGGGTM